MPVVYTMFFIFFLGGGVAAGFGLECGDVWYCMCYWGGRGGGGGGVDRYISSFSFFFLFEFYFILLLRNLHDCMNHEFHVVLLQRKLNILMDIPNVFSPCSLYMWHDIAIYVCMRINLGEGTDWTWFDVFPGVFFFSFFSIKQ